MDMSDNKYKLGADGQDYWDGTPEEKIAYDTWYAKTLIPFSITMRQCRRYLMTIDPTYALYDGVVAHIATLPRIDQEDWNACPDVWRSSPTVESLRVAFGWTEAQMDSMFVEAAKL